MHAGFRPGRLRTLGKGGVIRSRPTLFCRMHGVRERGFEAFWKRLHMMVVIGQFPAFTAAMPPRVNRFRILKGIAKEPRVKSQHDVGAAVGRGDTRSAVEGSIHA